MNEQPTARLLPVLAACASIGVGKTTFYDEVSAGRIRVVKVKNRTFVAPADLDDYVELLRAEAATKAS